MSFIREVIAWYQVNKRDLPWRKTNDPYVIWLSEIILQQTRVEQGLPYFYRFLEAYPAVADFAGASEDEILKLWQGLGYYSRGRNMHKTASLVMEDYGGYFPKKYEELIKLKGVGEYTAAAIASFAGNEPKAVVDGNVFRLLSRYYGIDTPINTSKGKKEFFNLANEIIDADQPGLSNQAIMEFGSLVCRPKNPDCVTCPLRLNCEAFRTGRVTELPVKQGAQKVRNRYFNYFIVQDGNKILLNKRQGKDIWHNLHDLPLIEDVSNFQEDSVLSNATFRNSFGDKAVVKKVNGPVTHVLSHQKIFASFFSVVDFSQAKFNDQGWFFVDLDELDNYAQPKLIFAFFKNFF